MPCSTKLIAAKGGGGTCEAGVVLNADPHVSQRAQVPERVQLGRGGPADEGPREDPGVGLVHRPGVRWARCRVRSRARSCLRIRDLVQPVRGGGGLGGGKQFSRRCHLCLCEPLE